MNKEIVVLDYGSGNLFSISQALEKCGAKVLIADDHSRVMKATHLVIPGVGAFGQCMAKIISKGLSHSVKEAIKGGTWILGICAGMQILFDKGEEFGFHEGLGIIPGNVVAIPPVDLDGTSRKIPYIGWSPLQPPLERDWRGSILESIGAGNSCYFVHSFMAMPDEGSHRLADTYYGQTRICAAIQSENVFGTQFHPEKSGLTGLAILTRFLEL
jgi:glutamine amidotransferase